MSTPRIDRSRANLRGLAALGLVMPFADQVKPQLDSISSQLQQAQAAIDANNQTILQLEQSQPGIDLSAEGAQQVQAQNQQNDAVNKFTLVYRAVYGTVPPGLSGLGQFDPVSLGTIVGIVAALGIVAGIIAAVFKIANTVQQSLQVKQTQANNFGFAQQQLAAAQASGDTAAAAQWAAIVQQQAPMQAPGGGFLGWIQQNVGWVVAGVVGVVLIREVW